ncbi:MAG: hypothetical protein B7Z73_19910, partial [Planctomycetia bacterium 21-64-5]
HLKQARLSEATRLNIGKSLLLENNAALLKALARSYKLKLYFVSVSSRLQPGDADDLAKAVRDAESLGESTRLGDGLGAVIDDLRGNPPSAVLVFSDGINTDGSTLADAAARARRKGVPLFTVALGSEMPVRDVELSDVLVDEVVFVDDVVRSRAAGRDDRHARQGRRDGARPAGISAHRGGRIRLRGRSGARRRRKPARQQSPAAARQRAKRAGPCVAGAVVPQL